MAMSSLQIIEARAPHLEGRARLPDLVLLAQEQLSADIYGTRYAQAVALLVLHWLAKESKAGAPGPVTSETEGELSKSYGWSGVYGEEASTSYGLELLELKKRTIVASPFNRMVP